MCLPCPARVPNTTMHLSRHRKLVPVARRSMRPGDGDRSAAEGNGGWQGAFHEVRRGRFGVLRYRGMW